MRKWIVFPLFLVLLVISGCSGEDAEGKKKKRMPRMGAREGVWRGLKLLEASLNHRNFGGYIKVFGGMARRAILKELTETKFRKNIHGRYKLAAFRIVKRHSRQVVTVKYVLYQYLPGRKAPKKIKGEGMFSAVSGLSYWVIISFK